MDTRNKAFVEFNENPHHCVWIWNVFTWIGNKIKKKENKIYFRRTYPIFTQALGGLESFITMIGHWFPKFYNASLYATFLKYNFWKQKLRMSCKVLCIHIYSTLKMGLFTLTFHCNIIGYRSRRFLYFIKWEYLFKSNQIK
jgi:hypothetical protein